jgi:formylglycine-generating enzyme
MREVLGRGRGVRRASCALLLAGSALLVGSSADIVSSRAPEAQLGDLARCRAYAGLPDGFGTVATAGMVWIAGGQLALGSTHGYPEERGGTTVQVDGFWIDRTEVTNAQFARFVAATGYITEAEREGRAPVFRPTSETDLAERGSYAWWTSTAGASWRKPAGPSGSNADHAHRPVVQVTHADALAYARWLGRTLPSERQWEYAAKAGRSDATLHHEPRDAHGRPRANFWQGRFPSWNSREDGFADSAPVGCFAPNPFGLYDMLGNVWEWTGSPYTSSHRPEDRADATLLSDRRDGGDIGCSAAPERGTRLVLKGGSFLCAASFCARFRVAARHAQEPSQAAMHVGFRTVLTKR